MCGIAGQLRLGGHPIDPATPGRMCAGLEHRGPDARGIHADAQAWIGIQRLRVIDLDTGDQPVYNEDRSVAVVLNGEIYNYRELRGELAARGHAFRTQGDTEVIAHLYEELGAACVERLHGMFAIALWDRRAHRLLLARDRVGKKPLVYALGERGVSFASELGALLADPEVPRDVDPAAIDAYLGLGYVPTPMTALKQVRKLPPAHTLEISLADPRPRLRRYWRLDYAAKLPPAAPEELREQLWERILAATRRRMIADVPLGAFLSGGIDSSAVVAAMAELSSEPVRTFSIGFGDAAFDELPHARRIAERFGTVHEEFRVEPDAIEILPRVVRHYGEPFADSSAIPSFYLAEMTSRRVTVALNGDGGDESFGGYTRYVANSVAAQLDRVPAPLRHALAELGARLPERGRETSVRNKLRRLSRTLALDGGARYARYVAWFDAAERRALYAPEFAAAVRDEARPEGVIGAAWDRASGTAVVDRMLEVDVSTYLVDDLIAKIDIATMAHGLEARSPLLDHELMQFAASLPAGLKIRGRQKKWILREALRGRVPDELLDRPKQGFSVPLSSWLRGELRGWSRDVLLDPRAAGRGQLEPRAVEAMLARHDAGADGEAKRIWALLMLELWHAELLDRAAAGRLPLAA